MKGGNKILVLGRGFSKTASPICKFGTIQNIGVFINDHKIKCTVPKSTFAHNIRVSVSCKKGIFSGGNIFYTYFKTPHLYSIFPTCGPIQGGTEIILKGKNYISGYKN